MARWLAGLLVLATGCAANTKLWSGGPPKNTQDCGKYAVESTLDTVVALTFLGGAVALVAGASPDANTSRSESVAVLLGGAVVWGTSAVLGWTDGARCYCLRGNERACKALDEFERPAAPMLRQPLDEAGGTGAGTPSTRPTIPTQ